MTDGKCCGTCRHHWHDEDSDDWYCNNLECDNYADYTGYEDGFLCDEYEARHPRARSLSETVERAIRRMQ